MLSNVLQPGQTSNAADGLEPKSHMTSDMRWSYDSQLMALPPSQRPGVLTFIPELRETSVGEFLAPGITP
jgi:hypothetical protein